MDFSSLVLTSSNAWTEFSSTGVVGETFRILKETADWLDSLNKVSSLDSRPFGYWLFWGAR